jgi:hypothetical protein
METSNSRIGSVSNRVSDRSREEWAMLETVNHLAKGLSMDSLVVECYSYNQNQTT